MSKKDECNGNLCRKECCGKGKYMAEKYWTWRATFTTLERDIIISLLEREEQSDETTTREKNVLLNIRVLLSICPKCKWGMEVKKHKRGNYMVCRMRCDEKK